MLVRQLNIKTVMGTKEFTIFKIDDIYKVDVIAYGNWETFTYFDTVKDVFDFIRSWL